LTVGAGRVATMGTTSHSLPAGTIRSALTQAAVGTAIVVGGTDIGHTLVTATALDVAVFGSGALVVGSAGIETGGSAAAGARYTFTSGVITLTYLTGGVLPTATTTVAFTAGFVPINHTFNGRARAILTSAGIVIGNSFKGATSFTSVTVRHFATMTSTFGVCRFPITSRGGLTGGFGEAATTAVGLGAGVLRLS
jgi:hypothetical protein